MPPTSTPANTLNQLLRERSVTHGDWAEQARMSQDIYGMLARNDHILDPVVREGLRMIAMKLSRISCGDPTTIDHWDDIAGYARLTAGYLRKMRKETTPLADLPKGSRLHTHCPSCNCAEGETHRAGCRLAVI